MRDEETIFEQALQIESPEDRAAFLDQACAARPELRQQVEALLQEHDRTGGILESSPVNVAVTQPTPEHVGAVIGRYKLLEQIGEGGMGAVFMAEQIRPVRRRVALKIIKPGMNNRQVIARFEAERQALAVMDHPNIAKVFDAGTTENGQPYFVMELVKGVPLTEYCDQHQLSPRERLELFTQVCQAVQHAHQKGIIHRDLKPNNVLVTLDDTGKPTPKVIDFGIAKATDGQRLTDRTLFTEFRQLVGTPLYMSPEQAEMNALADVDTRSDVYSLGVMLYELLTGTTPFEKDRLAKAAYDEVRRIIREEDPPRPSTRLSALGDAAATTVSAHRQMDPKRLGQLVHGELDWIVMKALEKDRERRYQTANGFARDLERYLADQPVEASPPSQLYRFRKFARRNKTALTTATLFVIVLVAATIVSVWQRHTALVARAVAETSERKAVLSEGEAKKQTAEAQRQNRIAQRRLAEGYLTQAQSALNLGNYLEAKTRVDQATEAYQAIGDSTLPADFLWLDTRASAPEPLIRLDDLAAGRPEVHLLSDGRTALIRQGIGTVAPGIVELIDLRTGAVLRTFKQEQAINATALSADGRFLLTGGSAEVGASARMSPEQRLKTFELTMWDVQTGKVIKTLQGHQDILRYIAISADGKRAVSSGIDKAIKVWDLETGKVIHEHKAPATVTVVAISPDGHLICTNEHGGREGIWDVASGKQLYHGGDAPLAFSADGKKVLFSEGIWDYQNAKSEEITPKAGAGVFLPGEREVLLAEASGVCRRDAQTGQLYQVFTEAYTTYQLSASSDGRFFAAGSGAARGAIAQWALQRRLDLLNVERGSYSSHSQVTLTPDGHAAICARRNGFLGVWDLATGLSLRELNSAGTAELQAVAVSPDGKRVLAGAEDGRLHLWDLASGKLVRSWAAHEPAPFHSATSIATIAFSPDGKRAVSGGDDAVAKVWDVETGKQIASFRGHWKPTSVMSRTITAAIFTPDGSQIISSCRYDNQMRIWDASTGEEKRILVDRGSRVASAVQSLQWISGGRLLWSIYQGETHITDLQSARDLLQVEGDRAAATNDGGLLTCVAGDTVRLYDGTSGRELARSQYDRGGNSIDLSADGRYLVTLNGGYLFIRDLRRPARARELEGALPLVRKTLQSNPNDAAALKVLGEWYAFRGVGDWGAEFLEKARAGGEDVSHLTLARCYWLSHKREDAQREFKLAIDANEAPRPYLELCLGAVETLAPPSTTPANQIVYDDQWLWQHLIDPVAWRQDPAKALALAREDAQAKPDDDHALQVLGWALYRSGDYKASIEALEKSIQLQNKPRGGDPWQWLWLAMDYGKLGQTDVGRAWYSISMQWLLENPNLINPEAKRMTAEAASVLGMPQGWPLPPTDSERHVYQRILKLNKDADWPLRQLSSLDRPLATSGPSPAPAH